MDQLETMKSDLRREVRQRLAARDIGELRGESLRACENLLTLPELERVSSALLYVPMRDARGETDVRRELDSWPLLHALVRRGVRIALPGVDWEGGELVPRWIRGLAQGLVVRRHGVPEPPLDQGWEPAATGGLGLVVVPGSAFDLTGGRLGRGGGFYDRLLSRVRPPALVVGLAYDDQVVDRVPTAEHDVRVGAVVTPSRILRPGATEGPGRVR